MTFIKDDKGLRLDKKRIFEQFYEEPTKSHK